MIKFFRVILCSGLIIMLTCSSAFAATDTTNEKDFSQIADATSTISQDEIQPSDTADLTSYRKEKVVITYEWTAYARISDNVKTGSKSASIQCSIEKAWSGSVSGFIFGIITIGTGATLKSTVGYTMTVPPYKTQYMAYKVRYKVERGTRVTYNNVTGSIISKNSYTVKQTMYGQYALLDY